MPEFLTKTDGQPFTTEELGAIRVLLQGMPTPERETYRNGNASHLASDASRRMLIVSGPGTGKSTLFKQKINAWLGANPSARILALSFVRKLVADLANDIQSDIRLSDEQKGQTEVHTLHKYARSLVERNHGCSTLPLRPHFKIIGPTWKDLVWEDTLRLATLDLADFKIRDFDTQLHTLSVNESPEWKRAIKQYFDLCKFYNAVGFADLILRAEKAVKESPALREHTCFIVDEFQDFNQSEETLIKTLTEDGDGVLIVGDDDQVLYERLKSGKASLIRDLYANPEYANGMLPFCGRCGFHIVNAAQHFISQGADENQIEKIYLPIKDGASCEKVQVVACAKPTSAIEYVRKFVEEHRDDLEERKRQLESGASKDAYLLILVPSAVEKMFGEGAAEIQALLNAYRIQDTRFSEQYYRVLTYYSLANAETDNFSLRKVLAYEGIPNDAAVALVARAIAEGVFLSDIDEPAIRSALEKARGIKAVFDSETEIPEKIRLVGEIITVPDQAKLIVEVEAKPIGAGAEAAARIQEEEDAELEEIGIKKMAAVELMSIVGSKGLSADHVIILGVDDVNMSLITRNAFYVAMTRARSSLHLITAMAARGARGTHAYVTQLPEAHVEFHTFKKGGRVLSSLADLLAFREYFGRILYARGAGRRSRRP